jgi:CheY-like chemotaxis protein
MSHDGVARESGPTILLVEDDVDIMRILKHMLMNAGYHVVPAAGGEEALQILETQRPDLVLTDLAMPGVGGIDVIEHVKRSPSLRQIPCVAVTAHVWDAVARVADAAGCNGFVFKPFNNRQLLKELQRHLSPRPVAPRPLPAAGIGPEGKS